MTNRKKSGLVCYSGGFAGGKPLVASQEFGEDEPDISTIIAQLTERIEALEALMADDPVRPKPKKKHGVNALTTRRGRERWNIKPRATKHLDAGVVEGRSVVRRLAPH